MPLNREGSQGEAECERSTNAPHFPTRTELEKRLDSKRRTSRKSRANWTHVFILPLVVMRTGWVSGSKFILKDRDRLQFIHEWTNTTSLLPHKIRNVLSHGRGECVTDFWVHQHLLDALLPHFNPFDK